MRGFRRFAARSSSVLPALLMAAVALAAPPSAEGKKARHDKEKAEPEALPTVAEKTRQMERREGLLSFYLDAQGKLWLELPPPAGDDGEVVRLLYVEGLAAGLGSNPVGLDRGLMGDAKLLAVRRIGRRVLLEQPNLRYRARSGEAAERRAARESFASSVIWAQEVGALDANGRALVDLTSFVVRDARGVARTLRQTGQGKFTLDTGRSLVDPRGCLAFPDNLELEAILTFAAEGDPGGEVAATAPTPEAITLVQHHSFIRLPDDGYRPRRFDPRVGTNRIRFADYAAPLAEPLERSWITRHRLRKVDPEAARSRVEEPLVYYLDRGAPEPLRSALLAGAGWWAGAFEKAGLVDAFRVELLPEGIHPLDARYNVIQWVHRATRGWSYGGGVIDPRSGEIVKGMVILGSLRVRQDRRLFEGLAGTEATGSGAADDPVELALARIRQLAAHEVGHTLGLSHNFAASTYAGRASVMDYPAPLIGVTESGELDFSRAYGVGVGAWDDHLIRYAYSDFPAEDDERRALEEIVREGIAAGYVFVSDADARPPGAAEPRGNLWDNGEDPVAGLQHALEVRRIALARFGERNVAPGRPLATLEETLAPLYFHHRYQLDAAVKVVGGLEYNYALRGDGQWATRRLDGARQRRALAAVLRLLEPRHLDLPEEVLRLLAPRPHDWPRNREMFAAATAPAFDALGAARSAADQAVAALLVPERLARLVDFHRRDPALPGMEEVLGALLDKALGPQDENPRLRELQRLVRRTAVDRLLAAAASPQMPPALRARLEAALREARRRLDTADDHTTALAADIDRFFARTAGAVSVDPPAAALPPGSPIGSPDLLGGCGFADEARGIAAGRPGKEIG